MPRNATLAQRIVWHRQHAKQCACRPIPAKLLAQMGGARPKQPAWAPRAKARRALATAGAEVDPRLAPVAAAFAGDRAVTTGGKGFGAGALKVDGKIFAMISSKGTFVVKLPKARVDELVRAGQGAYFDPGHGRLMKEWLAVDDAADAPADLIALAIEARQFVGGKGSRPGFASRSDRRPSLER
jgi:hypothetical protein